jgi:hypothetical protein
VILSGCAAERSLGASAGLKRFKLRGTYVTRVTSVKDLSTRLSGRRIVSRATSFISSVHVACGLDRHCAQAEGARADQDDERAFPTGTQHHSFAGFNAAVSAASSRGYA